MEVYVTTRQTTSRQAAFDGRAFRDVLAHVPTGVTVIAAQGENGPIGMAMNSFSSVSLDPALVLFCPGKLSSTWPKLRSVGRFCVNVLAGHQGRTCRRFAAKEADRFTGVAYVERPGGPALVDALAWIDCVLDAEHDGGDHTIVVARVTGIAAATDPIAEPLVFYKGAYGSFAQGSAGIPADA